MTKELASTASAASTKEAAFDPTNDHVFYNKQPVKLLYLSQKTEDKLTKLGLSYNKLPSANLIYIDETTYSANESGLKSNLSGTETEIARI